MKKRAFLPTVAIFIIALVVAGFAEQRKVVSAPPTFLEKRIALLEEEIAQLKAQFAEVSRRFQPAKEDLSPSSGESKPFLGPRAWTEGTRGWEEDGTNIWTSNLGYNVGIGTNNPVTPFHLVGDFYNQGFAGVKNNYDPGATFGNVAEVTITTHGTGEDNSVVLIFAHVQTNMGSYADMFIRVRRGGTDVAIACAGGYPAFAFAGATIVSYDEPPPGTHTYTLELETVLSAYGYNFFVIELKR